MEAYHRLSLTINAIAPDDSYRPPTLVGMRNAAAAFGQHLGHEVCGVSIQPFQLNTAWEKDRYRLCFVSEMKWRKQNGADKRRKKPNFTGF
jgi:hypothetical protein